MADKGHRVYPPLLQRARELRQPQTLAEQKLWARLRNRRLNGLKFRRQHPIGRFIADFCCVEHRMVVEIDGDSHADREAYGQMRTEWLNEQGYSVIRFTNQEVHRQMTAVLDAIWHACQKGEISDHDGPAACRICGE